MSVTSNVLEATGGPDEFPPEHEAAWVGILQAHAELTRTLDAALTARHALTFGAYEILARLAHEPERHLRMSDLAEGSQLSLSRVSRVVDVLQQRGHVERRSCPEDSRVVRVTITESGAALVADAQKTFLEVVEKRFLGRLPEKDVRRLGDILARLVGAPLSCPPARR